jgi:hypothetical protein|tara:strand:- start:2939 stop:3877 length:939 start_codon:yes stop_codon:yes gene_type:complete
MKIRILNEKKLTKKDKRQKEKYVKGMKSKKKDFQKRYGDDAEDVMYATATNMAKEKKEEQLDELSSMAGGNVAGPSGPIRNNKDKDEEIVEMYSTSTAIGAIPHPSFPDDPEDEHEGHVERSRHQGLRNVMEDDDATEPMQGFDSDRGKSQGTIWKLSDFADNSRNASRVFGVLKDVEDNIGPEKLKLAVLKDPTAVNRITVMSDKFGYADDLYERIESDDIEAIKKYYQFLINEFLFWIAYNPMSSAQQYAGRHTMLSKPTKDLAYSHIYRYVNNPKQNNPKNLGGRISKQADFYKLEKDLDPALYDLPEE